MESLTYEVRTSPKSDYSRAEFPEVALGTFDVRFEREIGFAETVALSADGSDISIPVRLFLIAVPRRNYSSPEDARADLDPLLRAWSVATGLDRVPGEVWFDFRDAEVSEQDAAVANVNRKSFSVKVRVNVNLATVVTRGSLEPPPSGFVVDETVALMYERYTECVSGRAKLGATAQWLLTEVERVAPRPGKGGGRNAAARHFSVDGRVLSKLGELAAKGSKNEARKAPKAGEYAPLSSVEQQWLHAVLRRLIRRVGEVASGEGRIERLEMANFPSLAGK